MNLFCPLNSLPQLFRVFPNFHECFYNSIETRKTCFSFFFRKYCNEKKKHLVCFDHQNVNSLFSRHHYVKLVVFLSTSRNKILNQSEPVSSFGLLSKTKKYINASSGQNFTSRIIPFVIICGRCNRPVLDQDRGDVFLRSFPLWGGVGVMNF